MKLSIITTDEWGASPREAGPLVRPAGIIVYSARGAERTLFSTEKAERTWAKRLARRIQRENIQSGMGDSAHHFLVTIAGVILEGRHGTVAAATRGCVVPALHSGGRPQSHDCWGILLEGDCSQMLPPFVQWVTLRQLCAHLCLPSHLMAANIWTRFANSAEERDTALHEELPRLREEVKASKMALLAPALREATTRRASAVPDRQGEQ